MKARFSSLPFVHGEVSVDSRVQIHSDMLNFAAIQTILLVFLIRSFNREITFIDKLKTTDLFRHTCTHRPSNKAILHFHCSAGCSDLSFHVKSGVRQRCVMPASLFNIIIDWALCRAIEAKRRGKRWKMSTLLEDLDYADHIREVLSHSFGDIQDKN